MPVIPFVPLIASVAGGLIGKIGSKNKGAAASTPLLPPGLDQNALLATIGQQKDLASLFQTQGADLLGKGQGVLNQPLDYFQKILGGDRTSIMQAMAPGIAAINAQFKNPIADSMISGRGGPLAPDQEASRQSAISSQIFQAQPAAADKLSGIAQNLMGLGLNQEQAGGSILGQTGTELLDYNSIIRGLQAQAAQQSSGTFGQLGSSLGPLLAQILTGVLGGKGGTTAVAPSIPGFPIPDPSSFPLPGPGGLGGDSTGVNPALTASLINFGSGGAPTFNSSWLTKG